MNSYLKNIPLIAHWLTIAGLLLIALSGLGLWSTLASFGAPILWARTLRTESLSQGLLSSLVFGFGGWLVNAWWLGTGIVAMNPSYWWAGYLSVVLLGGLAAIPHILFGYFAHHLRLFHGAYSKPVLAAALISLGVELSPNPFPGSLVNGVTDTWWLLQILDCGGGILVHFSIYCVSFSIAVGLDASTFFAKRVRFSLVAACLLLLNYGYAGFQKNAWRERMGQGQTVNVGIVQPNIPIKHGANYGTAGSLESLGKQTTEILLRSAPSSDLVVWPEIPIYFSPFNAPPDQEFLNKLLAGHQTPLLLNADMFANERRFDRIPFYNVEQLLIGSSQIQDQYQKMILVPMGEYLPFEEYLTGEYFREILLDVRRYAPGRDLSVIRVSPNLLVGTPICLELLHSEHVGEMVRLGAQLLVNPSNDAYFGRTPGATLNFTYARLRAIEFRIPVVRVTNTGISAAIDQLGEIVPGSLLPEFEPASAVVPVSVMPVAVRSFSPRVAGIVLLSLLAIVSILSSLRIQEH